MYRFINIAAFLLFGLMGTLHAQTSFTLSVNADAIGREDLVVASYSAKGKDKPQDFTAPEFTDWQVISGPELMNSSMSTNGDVTYETTFTYVLKPLKAGRFTIPRTSIVINNKNIFCKDVSVQVKQVAHVQNIPQPNNTLSFGFNDADLADPRETMDESFLKPGETVAAKAKNNIFFKAVASKTTCYEGEPVLVDYKLYTRLTSNSHIVKQPEFTSCSVEELTPRSVTRGKEIINGKEYNTFLIRKVLITPRKTGIISLLPGTIENTITFFKVSKNLRDSYYNDLPQQENYTLQSTSNTLNITVKPLPATTVKNFTGAIGRYNIEAHLQKPQSAKGENNAVIITFSGQGNFDNVELPKINWPKTLEVYEAKETDTIDKNNYPFSGTKTFEIPIVAKENGVIDIEGFAFTYFDVTTNKYSTIYTKPLSFKSEGTATISNSVNDGRPNEMTYIWLVPFIAICAGFILWFKFFKKKKQPETIAIAEAQPIYIAEEKDFKAVYDELLLIQNDKEFFDKACALADEMYAVTTDEHQQKNLIKIKSICSEALYLPGATVSKKEVIDLFGM